jgi:hypothetical protein
MHLFVFLFFFNQRFLNLLTQKSSFPSGVQTTFDSERTPSLSRFSKPFSLIISNLKSKNNFGAFSFSRFSDSQVVPNQIVFEKSSPIIFYYEYNGDRFYSGIFDQPRPENNQSFHIRIKKLRVC